MPYTNFKFPISAYFPQALQEGYTEKELRKEYSRLRDVAHKSLKRMGQSEFRVTQTYLRNKDLYKPLKEIKGKTELVDLLSSVAQMLSAKGGSLSGLKAIRKQTVATWRERGLTFVTEANYFQWIDFLEYMRATGFVGGSPDSDPGDEFTGFKGKQGQLLPKEQIKAEFKRFMELVK